MSSLSPRQAQLLALLHRSLDTHGVVPSYREMALEMGWKSTNSVARAIGELERMGHLRRAAGHSRALQLTKRNRFPQVSLVGIIAAGKPIMPFEDVEEVEVPPMLMGNGETFALRVKGDSMRDDGILEGDIVLVEKRAEARNGEVVVALIDGEETTLKQFSLKGDTVTLTPANTTMEPMRFMADRVTIQGVVVGQMRTYRPVSP